MTKKKKRKIDVLVLSDIHLGTLGCNANELLQYLKSIKPKKVILNGDLEFKTVILSFDYSIQEKQYKTVA